MADQPEALRLADRLQCNVSCGIHWDAASELRRLHDIEKAYESACGIIDEQGKKLAELEAVNAELLEALRNIVNLWDHHASAHGDGIIYPLHEAARAAIEAALKEKNNG